MTDNSKQQKASQWVHDYSDTLFAYTAKRVSDAPLAKDIVQETFLAAWRNIDTYNGKASIETWLFAILKNKIIDHYRKAATRFEKEHLPATYSSSRFFDDAGHWVENEYPKDWGINHTDPIEVKEFYIVLNGCRTRLNEIQNTVFSLKYLDGLESEEICKVLQISPSNYWVIIHRAKIQLRACLEKDWFIK